MIFSYLETFKFILVIIWKPKPFTKHKIIWFILKTIVKSWNEEFPLFIHVFKRSLKIEYLIIKIKRKYSETKFERCKTPERAYNIMKQINSNNNYLAVLKSLITFAFTSRTNIIYLQLRYNINVKNCLCNIIINKNKKVSHLQNIYKMQKTVTL